MSGSLAQRGASKESTRLTRRQVANALLGSLTVSAFLFVVPAGSANASQAPTSTPIGQVPSVPAGSPVIGPAGASTPLQLDVALAPQDPSALASFINQLYTPGSPEYHQYLTPGQFGPMFGATQSTVTSVSSSLSSLGLNPGPVSENDLSIPVSTTVAGAEAAFGVQEDQYSLPSGRIAHTNTSAPKLPSAIALDVTDIIGLSNVVLASAASGKVSSGSTSTPSPSAVPQASGPTPCAAASATGSATANQLAHAYGFDTGAYAGGRLGAGETVALLELQPFASSDISAYESCYGISTSVSTVNVDGGPGTGVGSGEAAGDIEDIAGLAPAANIVAYQAPNDSYANLYDVYNTIAMDDAAQVVSSSWGNCESDEGASFVQSEESIFEQMATQGQSMVAASFDSGSTDCFYHGAGSDALAVSDVASDPYVTGVGGTQISAFGPPPTEAVWNDPDGASGGGISEIWAMPSYQKALGVNADSSGTPCGAPAGSYCREVPDVSAMAGSPYYIFYHDGSWGGWDGTSFATPLWGSLTALADEGCSKPAGFLNPALYAHSGDLNDITSGNNDDTASGYTGGLYPATKGYDMATGLGTPTSALFAPGVLCTAPSTPTTSILIPSNGATLSGSTTLDASASNATSVEFRLLGGIYGYSGPVVCTATPTYYGWLCSWNTATVPNGSYTLVSEASGSGGTAYSSGVGITVGNPPTTSILIPSNGATLSGSTTLDASASNATSVKFLLFGGKYGFSAPVVCTATPTYYGWLCSWNTTTVPNGSYTIVSEAFNSVGSASSSGVSMTVKN